MNLDGLLSVPTVIMALVVAAAIGVAGFLAIDGLQSSTISYTASCGRNSSGGTDNTILYTGCGEGYNSSTRLTTALGNIFDFAPTWGTLVGVAVLILIIAGAFVVGAVGYKYYKGRGGW